MKQPSLAADAFSISAMRDAEDECGDGAADEVRHEIPPGVFIAADVGVGDGEDGDELDDFIERAKAHAHPAEQLAAAGARVEAVFFCPHAPEDACGCRKPEPGLFQQIGERFGLPLEAMPAAGNALRHVQAAAAAGCPTHLLLTGKSEHLRGRVGQAADADLATLLPELPPGTRLHEDLSGFVDWLLAQDERQLEAATAPASES